MSVILFWHGFLRPVGYPVPVFLDHWDDTSHNCSKRILTRDRWRLAATRHKFAQHEMPRHQHQHRGGGECGHQVSSPKEKLALADADASLHSADNGPAWEHA
eukprot:2456109-Pleurochrysis_carterae.AAC.1